MNGDPNDPAIDPSACALPDGSYSRMQPSTSHRVQGSSRELCPAIDENDSPILYFRHYAKCTVCAADEEARDKTEFGKGTALEPKATWWTKSRLERHQNSQAHKNAVKRAEARPVASLEQSVAQQQEKQRSATAKRKAEVEIQTKEQVSSLVRTVIQKAFDSSAFSSLRPEIELQKANGANVPDPETYGTHTDDHSAANVTVFLSDLEKDEIMTEVKKNAKWWSFCTDGSSDRSQEHVVAVLVMWIDHDGQTWMALWDIVECDGDAASQFAMLRVEFIELDWNKCVGGSLDGASVNFGTRNGIVARCTKVNPIVVFVHCSVRETKTLSLSLSLTHTHTHTHSRLIHTHTHTHTHTMLYVPDANDSVYCRIEMCHRDTGMCHRDTGMCRRDTGMCHRDCTVTLECAVVTLECAIVIV